MRIFITTSFLFVVFFIAESSRAAAAARPPLSSAIGAPSSVLLAAMNICRTYREGRRKITQYCEGEMVCDHAHAGKCKPGPALQRRLDAELRRLKDAAREAEAKLKEAERKFEAQMREFRRKIREQSQSTFAGNDNRAIGCSGCTTDTSLREHVYDPKIMPTPRYPTPRPPGSTPVSTGRSPATVWRPTPQTSNLRFKLRMRLFVERLNSFQPSDPRVGNVVRDMNQEIVRQSRNGTAGVQEALDEVGYENIWKNPPPASTAGSSGNSESQATPSPTAASATEPFGDPIQGNTASADPVPAASEPPPDEVLCAYLATLETETDNRLSQAVPDWCHPYLRSIGRTNMSPPPSPRQTLLTLDDEVEKNRLYRQFRSLLPPEE
jgi:hypothetical protein